MASTDTDRFAPDVCKPFLHEGGDTGVLLVHGFTGCVSHLRPLGDALAALSYTVMGINLPGHAQTEAAMARTGYADWLAAVRDAAVELRRHCAFVAVAGLSMGGLLALLAAAEGLADACVTISAPMPPHNTFAPLAALAAPFWPRVGKPPAAARRLLVDPAYDYGYAGYPTAKVNDLLRIVRMARRALPDVTCPLLAVQSTGDATVRQSSAETILRRAGSVQKQLLMLNGVHHVCTLTPALPQIVAATDSLLAGL
jgi:carboxylesterase